MVRPSGKESQMPVRPQSKTKPKRYADGRDMRKYAINAYTDTIFTSDMPLNALE